MEEPGPTRQLGGHLPLREAGPARLGLVSRIQHGLLAELRVALLHGISGHHHIIIQDDPVELEALLQGPTDLRVAGLPGQVLGVAKRVREAGLDGVDHDEDELFRVGHSGGPGVCPEHGFTHVRVGRLTARPGHEVTVGGYCLEKGGCCGG